MTKRKRTVLNYKPIENLYLGTEIFNVLKKFREKKQVSRYFNLYDCFALDTQNYIDESLRFNSFNQVELFKNENDQNLYFVKLDHYLNAIISYSFIKNLYLDIRADNSLNENVKNSLWSTIRDDFNLSTTTYKHSLIVSFFDLYSLSHVNNLRSFSGHLLHRARRNSILRGAYEKTLKAVNQLLINLCWDIQKTNKIYQCCLTGLFKRFGSVSSFYKDIPQTNLDDVSKLYRLVFYDSGNDLFVSNHLINNALYYEQVGSTEFTIKPIYISSKQTIIINVDEKTKSEFPSVQLTSNNNQLRAYDYRVIDGLPFAQMPYEKDQNKNFYLGVELEVNKSSRAPRNIVKMLEEKILSGTAICKRDGSLGNRGLELNIVPMTLDYAKQTNYWFNFEKNVKDYLYSYRDTKTGVHIHVPRHLLTRYQIALVGLFLNKRANLKFLNAVAGRDLSASSYSRVDTDLRLRDFYYETERYSVLNTIPRKTIEFRMFKGNISATTMYRYLEFVHALCFYARSNSMNMNTTYSNFIKFVEDNKADYPILLKFIKSYQKEDISEFKKIESFDLVYKRRFRNLSFNVPTLKLSEPLKFRRVRAIRTRASVPSSLTSTTTTTTN